MHRKMERSDLTPDLAGLWAIRRTVRGQARFAGRAEVRDIGGGAFAWREAGELRLADGAVLKAERRYLYQLGPETGVIEIRFDDGPHPGGLLHRFVFDGPARTARHRHPCPPDVYDAKLTLIDAGRFCLTYRVSGPRKDYVMNSSYRRIGRDPSEIH